MLQIWATPDTRSQIRLIYDTAAKVFEVESRCSLSGKSLWPSSVTLRLHVAPHNVKGLSWVLLRTCQTRDTVIKLIFLLFLTEWDDVAAVGGSRHLHKPHRRRWKSFPWYTVAYQRMHNLHGAAPYRYVQRAGKWMIDIHPLRSPLIFYASRGISQTQQNSTCLSGLYKELSPGFEIWAQINHLFN